ncbi:MAG TPA: class I SAM-dependent methyltransferase [Bauldia sp.]|nr:class I SAM-dependent methyltransferase [Bauldia sp.]
MRASGGPPVARAPVMLETAGWADYALLDSGHGRKLERYGAYRIVRPEEQAIWTPRRPAEWESADATFVGIGEDDADGRWRYRKPLAETWPLAYDGIRFLGRFTSFRHVGVFPEQVVHWDWMRDRIVAARRPARVLNLFAYTGIASLIAAKAGAEVVHIDASKKAIGWARENQAAAGGLGDKSIRWICEDAVKFVEREHRRGNRYEGIVLDPPKFGRGPKGEVWDIFADLPALLRSCVGLLSESPLFLILTAYSIRASFLSIHELSAECLASRGGRLESGELVIVESGAGGRKLSTSLFSRWSP